MNTPAGKEGLTPLMVAAGLSAPAEGARFLPDSTRPIDIAKELLEKGANVNAQSKSGITPLMIAGANNNAPMIGLLMESGADPTLKDAQGKTALDIAQQNGNLEAVQAIQVLGASKAASGTPAPADGQGATSQ